MTANKSQLNAMGLAATRVASAPTVFPALFSSRAAMFNNTGVAPFGVTFHADGTTDTDTLYPLHFCLYEWDFGDPNAGVHGIGPTPSQPRNISYGPIATHVFETPGTYTVTLKVRSASGIYVKTKTTQITVLDPASVYPGTSTICFSNTTDFTGAPANSIKVTTSLVADVLPYVANNVRLLFRRGDTFTATSNATVMNTIGTTGGSGGAFGSGADPVFNFTLNVSSVYSVIMLGNDWRWSDTLVMCDPGNTNSRGYQIQGTPGTTTAYDVETNGWNTLLRCKATSVANAFLISGIGQTVSDCVSYGMIGQPGVFPGTGNTGNVAMFSIANGIQYFGALFCSIDRSGTGEHAARFQGLMLSNFEGCYFKGANITKILLATRGMVGASAYPHDAGHGPGVSGKYIVKQCEFDSMGGYASGSFQAQVQNLSLREDIANVIVQGCLFRGADYVADYFSPIDMIIQGTYVTIRDNAHILNAVNSSGNNSGHRGVVVNGTLGSGSPTLGSDTVWIYNNSAYLNTATRMTYVSDVTDPANGGVAATNIVVKDNVGYGPNATANSSGSAAPTMLQMIYSTSWTASGNSSDSQLKNQDPGYTATTTWAGFKLQPGSYAAGKGIRFS